MPQGGRGAGLRGVAVIISESTGETTRKPSIMGAAAVKPLAPRVPPRAAAPQRGRSGRGGSRGSGRGSGRGGCETVATDDSTSSAATTGPADLHHAALRQLDNEAAGYLVETEEEEAACRAELVASVIAAEELAWRRGVESEWEAAADSLIVEARSFVVDRAKAEAVVPTWGGAADEEEEARAVERSARLACSGPRQRGQRSWSVAVAPRRPPQPQPQPHRTRLAGVARTAAGSTAAAERHQVAMLECQRVIDIDRTRRTAVMEMLRRTLSQLESELRAVEDGRAASAGTPDSSVSTPSAARSARQLKQAPPPISPSGTADETEGERCCLPPLPRRGGGGGGVPIAVPRIDTEKSAAVLQLEQRVAARKRAEVRRVRRQQKRQAAAARTEERHRRATQLRQRRREVRKQLCRLEQLEARHLELLRLEELRAHRVPLLRGDPDVLLGRKNILLKIDAQAAAEAEREIDGLRAALADRHTRSAMDADFYDSLRQHAAATDALRQRRAQQLLASTSTSATRTVLPRPPPDLRSKVHERIVAEEMAKRHHGTSAGRGR